MRPWPFESELGKRNFELTLIVEEASAQHRPRLVAYIGITRTKGKAFLHKVCVVEDYRNRGIASRVLRLQLEKMKLQGCDVVQLWVDECREPAKHCMASLDSKWFRKSTTITLLEGMV